MKRGEGSELLQVASVPWDSPRPIFGNVLARVGLNYALPPIASAANRQRFHISPAVQGGLRYPASEGHLGRHGSGVIVHRSEGHGNDARK